MEKNDNKLERDDEERVAEKEREREMLRIAIHKDISVYLFGCCCCCCYYIFIFGFIRVVRAWLLMLKQLWKLYIDRTIDWLSLED